MIPAPFAKSWWVEPSNLLAGCYPGEPDAGKARAKLTALIEVGIRLVICLQEQDEKGTGGRPFVPYVPVLMELAQARAIHVSCERFPIRDYGVPTLEDMNTILDCIDTASAAKLPVYLHCWGGHGRTATVVGCWLVRHGMAGEEALVHIEELRQDDPHLRAEPAPQTPAQCQMVREWARGDRMRGR